MRVEILCNTEEIVLLRKNSSKSEINFLKKICWYYFPVESVDKAACDPFTEIVNAH